MRNRHIVRAQVGVQLVQKPHPPLRAGKRNGIVAPHGNNRRRSYAACAAAQPVEFACRVDAFPGGEQPQRDEEADIDGRPARTAVAGPVARQQARKIQAADPFPDEAGLMVGGDEPVDDTGIDTGGTVGVAEADAGIVASGRAGRGGVRDCRVHGKEVQ